jgi:hypothetical protein
MPTQEWETRSAALWDRLDDVEEDELRGLVDALAGELGEGDPVASFERGCAADSTGHPDEAVRNLGQPERGVVLLEAERATVTANDGTATLDDALVCTLALCLADAGRAREGVGLMVAQVAPKLPRYQRSMSWYGRDMAGLAQD